MTPRAIISAGWLTREDAGEAHGRGATSAATVAPRTAGRRRAAPPPPIQRDAARTPEESTARTATVLGSSELTASFVHAARRGVRPVVHQLWRRQRQVQRLGAAAASAAATAASVVAAEAQPGGGEGGGEGSFGRLGGDQPASKEHRLVGRVHADDQPPEWFEVLPPEGIKNHPAVDATAAAQSAAREGRRVDLRDECRCGDVKGAGRGVRTRPMPTRAPRRRRRLCASRRRRRSGATQSVIGRPRAAPARRAQAVPPAPPYGFAEPVRDAAPRPPRCNRTSPRRTRGDTSDLARPPPRRPVAAQGVARDGQPAGANTSFPATSFPHRRVEPSERSHRRGRASTRPRPRRRCRPARHAVRVRRAAQQLAQPGGLRVARGAASKRCPGARGSPASRVSAAAAAMRSIAVIGRGRSSPQPRNATLDAQLGAAWLRHWSAVTLRELPGDAPDIKTRVIGIREPHGFFRRIGGAARALRGPVRHLCVLCRRARRRRAAGSEVRAPPLRLGHLREGRHDLR